MGQKVKIAYKNKVDLDGEVLSGMCMPQGNLVMISTSENDSEKEILSTLAHELTHLVIAKCGLSDLLGDHEEALVVAIEENLVPLFNFNRRKWAKREEVGYGSKD